MSKMKQMELMMSSKIEGSVSAVYQSTGVPSYEGNPLIECLPILGSAPEVIHRLNRFPKSVLRVAPADVRALELVAALSATFIGLPQHYDLASFIDTKIKQGYVSRNPNLKVNPELLQANYERMLKGDLNSDLEPNKVFTSPSSGSIYGIAGFGKTTSLERLLSYYPQVIHHETLNLTQITSLYINFPHDGNRKTLCKNFFNALNIAIKRPNTVWLERRETPESMLGKMQAAAIRFNIGILIIDEFQMWRSKIKDSKDVIDFLISLINTIKLPIIFSGTPAAKGKLESELTGARRAAGFNVWNPLNVQVQAEPNLKNEDKLLWDYFARKLWSYQYLSRPSIAFSSEISEAWFDCSQGIIDIAVKLYIQVQLRAIHSKKEEISAELIRRVFNDDFKSVHAIVGALRSKDPEIMEKYPDLPKKDITLNIATLYDSIIEQNKKLALPTMEPVVQELLDILIQLGYDKDIAQPAVEAVVAKNFRLDKKSLLPLVIELLTNGPAIKPKLKQKKPTKKAKSPSPEFDLSKQKGLFNDIVGGE
jgi:hypothetical protein